MSNFAFLAAKSPTVHEAAGSCLGGQRSRAFNPIAFTRSVHHFPQVASPLYVESEIRAVAQHAGEIGDFLLKLHALQKPTPEGFIWNRDDANTR
jgi:hypothetical protein